MSDSRLDDSPTHTPTNLATDAYKVSHSFETPPPDRRRPVKGLLFTYIMTYGGAIVSLFNPFYGLLVYICFAIIKPSALWHWSVPIGNYSRIIGVAFLVGWVLNGCGTVKLGRAKPIVFGLLGYWFWMMLSTALSPGPEAGWGTIEHYAKIVLPFIAGLTLIDSIERLKQLAWVLMFSTGYLAFEFNLTYYSSGTVGRFIGFDANTLSILTVAGCGLCFFHGLFDVVTWRRWLAFLAAALIAHIPMIGMSRGGMLAVAAAGVTSFLLVPKTPKYLWFFGLAVVAGLFLAGPSVVEEFQTTFSDKNELENEEYGRIYMWRACAIEMMKHPFIGVGQDRWPIVSTEYGFTENKDAHSLWAQTGAELGVPGLAFLLLFYGCTIRRLLRIIKTPSTPLDLQTIARMVIVGLTGFLVAASFVTVEGFEIPFYVVLLGAGCVQVSELAHTGMSNEESCAATTETQEHGSSDRPRTPPGKKVTV